MKRSSRCFLTLVAILTSGCGRQDGPQLYPVRGTVRLNGAAVADATVAFHSGSSPRLVTGRTNPAGEFELTTFEDGDGAVAAEYVVTVAKYSIDDSEAEQQRSMDDAMEQPRGAVRVQPALPVAYQDPRTSPLRATVTPDGANDFQLELNETSR